MWEWLAKEIDADSIQTIKPVFEEIKHIDADCSDWLGGKAYQLRQTMIRCQGIQKPEISNALIKTVNILKREIGIAGDIEGNAKGVDDNDMYLIASAFIHKKTVISNEAQQNDKPREKRNYKIPLVCQHINPGVKVLSFLEFIKLRKQIF